MPMDAAQKIVSSGAKAQFFFAPYGTAEAVPFQNRHSAGSSSFAGTGGCWLRWLWRAQLSLLRISSLTAPVSAWLWSAALRLSAISGQSARSGCLAERWASVPGVWEFIWERRLGCCCGPRVDSPRLLIAAAGVNLLDAVSGLVGLAWQLAGSSIRAGRCLGLQRRAADLFAHWSVDSDRR